MGKLFVFNMVSLDGYFAGPDNELDWHNVDEEFSKFAIEQLDEVGTLVFGRITYEMMASFWPTAQAIKMDPDTARLMNSLPKIVVSHSLERATWNNTRIIKNHLDETFTDLKKNTDKDIAIFGSSILSVSLIKLGLIDELRIMINPVVLGTGRSLFSGLSGGLDLDLLKTRVFKSGNVLLSYAIK